jgi:hypothetical protein
VDAKVWPHKSPCANDTLYRSDWTVPLFLERKGGDEGEERASPVLHRRFDAQRLLSKKTARMGDKAKPLVSHMAGGFAVFEAAFLCWPTHRELSKRSQMPMRLTLQGR